MPSFSEAERGLLLAYGVAVVYTPENEHFGIVPLEAMYARRPLIACSSGGPLESVLHGETGPPSLPPASAHTADRRAPRRARAQRTSPHRRNHAFPRSRVCVFSRARVCVFV